MTTVLVCILFSLNVILSTAKVPTVTLQNAARPNTEMPIVRLGTGGYGATKNKSCPIQPEHWNVSEGTINAIKWLEVGGTGFDSAKGYESAPGVAAGILNYTENWTKISRDKVWITYKTVLGYNNSINTWKNGLEMFNTTYFDLLLIHYPSQNGSNTYHYTDLVCNGNSTKYNATLCRQSTWKAYQWIYQQNGAKAIGISNFEARHQLQDILDMNTMIPAVNQFEFQGYWHEYQMVQLCQSLNITINSYSPLGTPDREYCNWYPPTPILVKHPTAMEIGERYKKTAAQVWLRWQWQQGIVVNPRSWNETHMKENMDIFDFELEEEEMLLLASVQPPSDPKVCGYYYYYP